MHITAKSLALITGSAACTLADHGRDVIVTYLRNADEAKAVVAAIAAKERKAAALQLDIGNVAGFGRMSESNHHIVPIHIPSKTFATSFLDHPSRHLIEPYL